MTKKWITSIGTSIIIGWLTWISNSVFQLSKDVAVLKFAILKTAMIEKPLRNPGEPNLGNFDLQPQPPILGNFELPLKKFKFLESLFHKEEKKPEIKKE